MDRLALYYVGLIKSIRLAVINTLVRLLFKKKQTYKNILINRDGAFGDSIVALPALSIIRQNFPAARIDLLSVNNSGIGFKDLNIEEGIINTLINIKKEGRRKALKKLMQNKYDLFIQIPQNIGVYKSVRNIFLVRFILKINNAFGWDHGRIKSFMRQQKKYLNTPTETERFVKILEDNGLRGELHYPIKSLKPKNEDLLKLIEPGKPVLFMIGGKLQAKKWPLDNWIALSKKIGSNYKILIIGGKDEARDAEYIISKTDNTINACGLLSIPELFYILKNVQSAISLDTGAMHLCDAANTNVIALISSRDLTDKWHPDKTGSVVLEKVLPCSFCLKTICADNRCMKNIGVDEVYEKFCADKTVNS